MNKKSKASIGVIILAAGNSTRLGKPKQLLLYQDKTLLRHAVDTALEADLGPVVVVTGALHQDLLAEIEGLPVNTVQNPDWQSGMASSIKVGVNALESLQEYDLKGVLIMLCDQPLITPGHLERLAAQFSMLPAQFVIVTAYDGSAGVPAVFGSRLFPQLCNLSGDQGAKQLFAQHRDRVIAIAFEDAAIDVDTEEDYERLLKLGNYD